MTKSRCVPRSVPTLRRTCSSRHGRSILPGQQGQIVHVRRRGNTNGSYTHHSHDIRQGSLTWRCAGLGDHRADAFALVGSTRPDDCGYSHATEELANTTGEARAADSISYE